MQKIFTTLFLFIAFTAFGQADTADHTSARPRIWGSADVYYRYNASAPSGSFNNFTKFTNTQNAFALGMASVKVSDSFAKVTAVANIGFGQRIAEYNYTEAGNAFASAIKEVYLSYALTKAIKLTAGKWYKHLGYEMADAAGNNNYSMSYLFTFGPQSYTGLKADIALSKKLSFMAGITNPADVSSLKYVPTKTAIASIGFTGADNKLKVKLNFQGYGGVSTPYLLAPGYYLYKSLQQYDAVAQLAVTSKLDIAYNGTVQVVNDGLTRDWNGNALYVTYKWKPQFAVTLRGEYIDDGAALKIGSDIFAATLSANFTLSNRLRFIPEIRWDDSTDGSNLFQKGSTAGTRKTFSGLLAAVYSLGKL